MAALSTFLLLNKEKRGTINKRTAKHLHSWLIQANENIIPPNNWHFFRVLLNLAMKHCEMPYSKEQIAVDLAVIDRFMSVMVGIMTESRHKLIIMFLSLFIIIVYCIVVLPRKIPQEWLL